MRTVRIIPILFFLLFAACRSDSDVIAGMNSLMITRAMFHQWLESRNIERNEVYSSPENTEKFVKQMAVEHLASETAVSMKFDSSPFFITVKRAVYANFLASYYKLSIKKNLVFSEPAAELVIIRLYFPGTVSGGLNREIRNDKITLASYIIRQIKAGNDPAELEKRYSEEKLSSSAIIPRVYPAVIIEPEILSRLKGMKDGESVDEPLILSDSVVVLKLIKWVELNNTDAGRIIRDAEIYNRFTDYLAEGTIEYVIAEKGGALKIVSNLVRAQSAQNDELLFSIDGRQFKARELDDLYNLFLFLNNETVPLSSAAAEKKLADSLFRDALVAAIAEKEGTADGEDFQKKWKPVLKSALAGSFKYALISGNIKISGLTDYKDLTGIADIIEKGKDPGNIEPDKMTISKKNALEEYLLRRGDFKIYRERLKSLFSVY